MHIQDQNKFYNVIHKKWGRKETVKATTVESWTGNQKKNLCGSYNVPTNVRNLQNGISKVQRTCTLQTLTHNGTRPLKLDNQTIEWAPPKRQLGTWWIAVCVEHWKPSIFYCLILSVHMKKSCVCYVTFYNKIMLVTLSYVECCHLWNVFFLFSCNRYVI